MGNELIKFNEWSIDKRLRQFRKETSQGLVFADFDSVEGRGVFKEYCQEQLDHYNEEAREWLSIIFQLEEGDFNEQDADCVISMMEGDEDAE